MKSHIEKYKTLNEKYGIKWNINSPKLVGESLESLTEKYCEDKYLNNVPLHLWDRLAMSLQVLIKV